MPTLKRRAQHNRAVNDRRFGSHGRGATGASQGICDCGGLATSSNPGKIQPLLVFGSFLRVVLGRLSSTFTWGSGSGREISAARARMDWRSLGLRSDSNEITRAGLAS